MPFVTAEDGVRIHYELDGAEGGIPLVLLHGLSLNHAHWRTFGYVDALRDRFRILLQDVRGHGESDHPHDPVSYDWRTLVLDTVAAIRDAGMEQAHLWGFSLGGAIAQSALIYAPQRLRSIAVVGASPYGYARDPSLTIPFSEFWPRVADRAGADEVAWGILWAQLEKFQGAIAALRTTKVPFRLYAGSEDPGANRGVLEFKEKYGGDHFILAGKTHVTSLYDPETLAVSAERVAALIDQVEAASK